MPSNNGKPKKLAGRSKGRSRTNRNINNPMLDIGLVGTRSDDHVITSDLTYRPVPPFYRSKPPRNLLNQVYFVRQTTGTNYTTSSTALTEFNLSFSATNDLAQYQSWLSLFDQYYIHCAIVTLTNPASANTQSVTLPLIYTAIDFDNVTPLSSVGIQSYSTCNTDVLAPGKSVTRIIMPCVSGSLSPGNSVTRLWVNSANANVPFYGFRSISAQSSPSVTIDVNISTIWAFRNSL